MIGLTQWHIAALSCKLLRSVLLALVSVIVVLEFLLQPIDLLLHLTQLVLAQSNFCCQVKSLLIWLQLNFDWTYIFGWCPEQARLTSFSFSFCTVLISKNSPRSCTSDLPSIFMNIIILLRNKIGRNDMRFSDLPIILKDYSFWFWRVNCWRMWPFVAVFWFWWYILSLRKNCVRCWRYHLNAH